MPAITSNFDFLEEEFLQFNRVAFKQFGEELFDKTFDFERAVKETASYAIIKKKTAILNKRKNWMFWQKVLKLIQILNQ